MPLNIMSFDVVVFIKDNTRWFCDPAWWLVFVTTIVGGAAVWVAWKQLKKLDISVGKAKDSVDKLEVTIHSAATGHLSIHYSALSIRTRYRDEQYNAKDVLDVIHDSLIERAGKIDKKKLEQLVEAAANLVDEIDKKE